MYYAILLQPDVLNWALTSKVSAKFWPRMLITLNRYVSIYGVKA